jgi:hypothetical protein
MNTSGFGTDNGSADDPVAQVREGMRVVDSTGADVGTAEMVKLGDPEAVTPQGQTAGTSGLMDSMAQAFGGGEPRVPDELAARMLRVGFVKVDGPGLLDRDRYVPADQVASVVDGVVHLTVAREALVRE